MAAEARLAGVGHGRGGGRWLVRGQDRRTKKRGAGRRKKTTRVDEATITRRSNDNNVTFDVGTVERISESINILSESNIRLSYMSLQTLPASSTHHFGSTMFQRTNPKERKGLNEKIRVESDMFNMKFLLII